MPGNKSMADGYYIRSFLITWAGIFAAFGALAWAILAFSWTPWALLAVILLFLGWFHRLDATVLGFILPSRHVAGKAHAEVERR
ncbi:MAG: hypothetical protein HY894_02930 [Deltaproteobacteria bacterium]|nr:hypothetical protein [Deltaproteobacteria bacterium]